MKYFVLYHHSILKEDVPELNQDMLDRIEKAIKTRLAVSPEQYGLPLRKTLRGYWKLRIGNYRIVYLITKNVIHILAIAHRSKVYKIAISR